MEITVCHFQESLFVVGILKKYASAINNLTLKFFSRPQLREIINIIDRLRDHEGAGVCGGVFAPPRSITEIIYFYIWC